MQKLLASQGISYRQTCPHTHHQNGRVERRHCHIVDTGLALLAQSHLPLHFWDTAFDTACFLINRLPSSLNSTKPLNYTFLKSCGCECLPYLRPYNSNKMASCSQSCVFIGYSKPQMGYRCLHVSSGCIYIARHVVFNEMVFPFHTKSSTPPVSSSTPIALPDSIRIPSPIVSSPLLLHQTPVHPLLLRTLLNRLPSKTKCLLFHPLLNNLLNLLPPHLLNLLGPIIWSPDHSTTFINQKHSLMALPGIPSLMP